MWPFWSSSMFSGRLIFSHVTRSMSHWKHFWKTRAKPLHHKNFVLQHFFKYTYICFNKCTKILVYKQELEIPQMGMLEQTPQVCRAFVPIFPVRDSGLFTCRSINYRHTSKAVKHIQADIHSLHGREKNVPRLVKQVFCFGGHHNWLTFLSGEKINMW